MFADDTNITISGSSLIELLSLYCWLKANKLGINVAKTEFMVIGSCQKFHAEISHNEINIKLEDRVISKVDYCSLVWDGLSDQLSDKLQKLQNRADRVVLNANYGTIVARACFLIYSNGTN